MAAQVQAATFAPLSDCRSSTLHHSRRHVRVASSGGIPRKQFSRVVTVRAAVAEEMEAGRAAMREWWLAKKAGGSLYSPASSGSSNGSSTASMDEARAAMRDWWFSQLAAKAAPSSSPPSPSASEADMEAGRAAMREWWTAQLAEKKVAVAMEEGRAAMREWWQSQLAAKKMDEGRAEMREWWLSQLEAKKMDEGRAQMREWWVAQLAGKATAASTTSLDADMDEKRAEMREWWLSQRSAKKMEEGRAAMREWWLSQQVEKQQLQEMEAGRAAMREWWLASKEAAAVSSFQKQLDESRVELNDWAISKWKGAAEAAQKESQEADMEAGRAAMREWWTQQLAAKVAAVVPATPPPLAAAQGVNATSVAAAESVAVKEAVDEEQEEEEAPAPPLPGATDAERAVIEREVARYKARRAVKQAEREADLRRYMDKGRAAMRTWWLEQWDTKKRSMGWGGYPPVPRLSLLLEPLSSAGVPQSTIDAAAALLAGALLGPGTVVGCAPVSQEGANTVELLIKGLSFSHALLYGEDKPAGYGRFTREYFVRDLGSTNGTLVNKKRVSGSKATKLSPGDVIELGPLVQLRVEELQA